MQTLRREQQQPIEQREDRRAALMNAHHTRATYNTEAEQHAQKTITVSTRPAKQQTGESTLSCDVAENANEQHGVGAVQACDAKQSNKLCDSW